MLANKTPEDLAFIARNGGGLDINGSGYTKENLAFIARNITTGSRFTIRGVGGWPADALAFIARNGNGTVEFVD